MRSKNLFNNPLLRCLRSPPYFAGICLVCWLAYCIVRRTSFTTNFYQKVPESDRYDEEVETSFTNLLPPINLHVKNTAEGITGSRFLMVNHENSAAPMHRRSIVHQNTDVNGSSGFEHEIFSTSTSPVSSTLFTESNSTIPLLTATGPPVVLSDRQHRMRTTFNFMLNEPDLCRNLDGSRPYIIAYVHTSPTNFGRRTAIRQSWADKRYAKQLGIKVFFLMGCLKLDGHSVLTDGCQPLHGVKQAALLRRLVHESRKYRDIVMADFVDSYWNLTLKNLAGLRWIQQHCWADAAGRRQSPPPYVLKADDDVFVDTFRLVRYLRSVDIFYGEYRNQTTSIGDNAVRTVAVSSTEQSLTSRIQQKLGMLLTKKSPPSSSDSEGYLRPLFDSTSARLITSSATINNELNRADASQPPPTHRTFFGYTYVKSRPIRAEHRKWFVTNQEFAGQIYPEYCAGAAYVHTIDVVKPLLAAAAKRQYYLSIDDVLITGVLRVEIGARVQAWNELYRFLPKIPNCSVSSEDSNNSAKIVSSTTASPANAVASKGEPVRTLGQCYISRRYVFVHLMKEAAAMVEIWNKVLQRERPVL